jgi:hypothetical protein
LVFKSWSSGHERERVKCRIGLKHRKTAVRNGLLLNCGVCELVQPKLAVARCSQTAVILKEAIAPKFLFRI